MYASSWVTLAGAAHTSIEYSPVFLMASASFALAVDVPCALPPAFTFTPQPPTHSMAPNIWRLSSAPLPPVS